MSGVLVTARRDSKIWVTSWFSKIAEHEGATRLAYNLVTGTYAWISEGAHAGFMFRAGKVPYIFRLNTKNHDDVRVNTGSIDTYYADNEIYAVLRIANSPHEYSKCVKYQQNIRGSCKYVVQSVQQVPSYDTSINSINGISTKQESHRHWSHSELRRRCRRGNLRIV